MWRSFICRFKRFHNYVPTKEAEPMSGGALGRSSIEAYLATIIGIVVWVLPVSLGWKCFVLILPLLLLCHILWKSPKTIRWKLGHKTIGALVLIAIYAGAVTALVIHDRRARESDFIVDVSEKMSVGDSLDHPGSLTLALYLTITNKGAPARIPVDSWTLTFANKNRSLSLKPRFGLRDMPVREADKTIREPFRSQDLLDQIDPFTKDKSVVGVLNFVIPNAKREELVGACFAVSFDDENKKHYALPCLTGKGNMERTFHIPGMQDRVLPEEAPSSSPP